MYNLLFFLWSNKTKKIKNRKQFYFQINITNKQIKKIKKKTLQISNVEHIRHTGGDIDNGLKSECGLEADSAGRGGRYSRGKPDSVFLSIDSTELSIRSIRTLEKCNSKRWTTQFIFWNLRYFLITQPTSGGEYWTTFLLISTFKHTY